MYVLMGSQFNHITVMHLHVEIQPDPVSQRHFQSSRLQVLNRQAPLAKLSVS